MHTLRRDFLRHGLRAAAALPFAAPLEALAFRLADGAPVVNPAFGPLRPAVDASSGLALLELPEGFRYLTFGWTGDKLEDGRPTPRSHDGMAAFAAPDGRVRLVRNHEVGEPVGAFGRNPYDRAAGGGTTTLVFDPVAERLIGTTASLAGTLRNCAGGPTPWGTWLTCEETVDGPATRGTSFERQHGYVFEVPAEGRSDADPIRDMGCFVHEAVAVDPATGIVYQTEDRAQSGLYRFIPRERGRLSRGGRLEMLAVKGRKGLDLRTGVPANATYEIEWVEIRNPDKRHSTIEKADGIGVFMQGYEQGGAVFARGEGAWFAGGHIYITATSGGNARAGQVWDIDPARGELRLLFESPGADVLNMPDNICSTPGGALLLCEDSGVLPRIQGLTKEGVIVPFARNAVVLKGERNGFAGDFRNGEFAGATFSPDGKWLFVNIQTPGITAAITGPWSAGGL